MSEKAPNISEKVLKYESFVNDVLKEELKEIERRVNLLLNDVAEYLQLKSTIQVMKDKKLSDGAMKTQVDIGCSFFVQANIDKPDKILLAVGLGYFVEYTLDEALAVINTRVSYLNKEISIYRKRSADTKAHIKLILLGLKELQQIS